MPIEHLLQPHKLLFGNAHQLVSTSLLQRLILRILQPNLSTESNL
ncbi:hypothetical protein [Stenomitos frigidus]